MSFLTEHVLFGHLLTNLIDKSSKIDIFCQISLFMALHDATSELLGEVSRWGEIKPVFDKDSLKVELKEESTRFIDDTEGKDTGFKNK